MERKGNEKGKRKKVKGKGKKEKRKNAGKPALEAIFL